MEDSNLMHSSKPATAKRPQQQMGLLLPAATTPAAVRHFPPSANTNFQTPSSLRSTRSLPHVTFNDSPFMSPPSTAATSHSSRNTRTTPQPLMYRNFDSPFQSPPPGTSTKRREAPQPLVLDPSASRQHQNYRHASGQAPTHVDQQPLAQKFLQVATGRIRDQLALAPTDHSNNMGVHSTPALSNYSGEIAASLARHAPKAGYLQKLGRNIPEYKRRFFVLQTETNLYYYLSPNDSEPRGKISMEGTRLEEVEHLPDGRYRFVILQDDGGRIVLEARSEQAGKEWIEQLKNQRVSTLNAQVEDLSSQVLRQKFQIGELEQQVENFKLVEKDRDGALDDARRWKEQFERLDEALRLLTQRMRQPPELSVNKKTLALREESDHGEEKKEADIVVCTAPDANLSTDGTPIKNNQSSKKRANSANHDLPSNLLDTAFHAVDDADSNPPEDIEEIMTVPGIYFSGLADACQQQRDSLRLAAEEAATAVDDVHEATTQMEEMRRRMAKAEKHLTKLWEENCTIRKSLKQTKREKRVLVREYKVLQLAHQELDGRLSAPAPRPSSMLFSKRPQPNDGKENERNKATEDTMLGSDEERLIDELEEHVASSIRLHERLMKAGDHLNLDSDDELNTSVDNSEVVNEEISRHDGEGILEDAGGENPIPVKSSPPPLAYTPVSMSSRMTSLMDDDDESESSSLSNTCNVVDDDNEDDDLSVNEYQSMMSPSLVSSVGAEFGSVADDSERSLPPSIAPAVSTETSPERPNPVLQLDRDDSVDEYETQPGLCSSSTQSTSTAPNAYIGDNGRANSKLSCPLVDVVETRGYAFRHRADTGIYHLTFYSKKIGIQFQKAPPTPIKPKGLLTAAMTVDINSNVNDSDKTAAELRNVAALSALAGGRNAKDEEVCPISLPKDVVLVCGFQGFDGSSNNKPKLGTRLVAFDGVSVEIGPWTFDAIRKSIQSRGRPLTLSFRNDLLTPEQRAVLTKAVMEVDTKRPPRSFVDVGIHPSSAAPSIASALSHDTEFTTYDDIVHDPNAAGNIQDLSTWVQEKDCCNGKLAAASSSVHSRLRRLSSGSHSTHQRSGKSFSDAGSSISSSFAPLVATLVKQANERRKDPKELLTPHYLRRSDVGSLEKTPQHRDFQANLL